jgi:Transposase DDE domain group 1
VVDQQVDLGGRPGAHRPGPKVLTLVHAILAGADCIHDADVLRTGSTAEVLGHQVMAPSTIGTFLRSFTFGHVRQLDRVAETIMGRAWAAGAGPGEAPLTIDLDATVCEVHGHHQGGAAYGSTRQLGDHPLLATRADTGEVLHARQRTGRAASGRGAERFVVELAGRVRRGGATGSSPCGPTRGSGRPRSWPPAAATASAAGSRCARSTPSALRSRRSPSTPGSTSTITTAASRKWPRPPWVRIGWSYAAPALNQFLQALARLRVVPLPT